MDIEKEIEKKYTELQITTQQMKQLQKQIALLNNQLVELTLLQQSINEIRDVKIGTSILVTIGNGIYAKAELKENNEFLVNVGSNTVVKKDIDSTTKLIQQQLEEISGVYEQMMLELRVLYEHANSKEEEINKLAKQI